MRNLVLILIVFIAVITFIRAFENRSEIPGDQVTAEFIVNQQ
jgi:hypothetical protein